MKHILRKQHFYWVPLGLSLLLWVAACENDTPSTDFQSISEKWNSGIQPKPVDKKTVLATVGGVAIYPQELSHHMKRSPKPLSKADALEELIQFHLLSQEAQKRGYGVRSEVVTEYKKALALAFLKKKGNGFTTRSLSESTLRNRYQEQKSRFVHGALRDVLHALVLTGNGKHSETEAKIIGDRIRDSVKNVSTEHAFRDAVKAATEGVPNIKIEDLPPFDAASQKFVKPFVKGTFAIQYPKERISKLVETQFGFHIIYIQSDAPAVNIPFEQARTTLEKELVQPERKKFIAKLIDDLYQNGKVFIYDNHLLPSTTGVPQ